MRQAIRICILAFVALCLAPRAFAAVSPLGLAIVPPVQFPPYDFTVAGARASVFWGKHRNVYGLDVGLLGTMTEQNLGGIQVAGGINYNKGMSTVIGLQAAGLSNINVNKAWILGVQATAGINSNQAESTIIGLSIGALANLSPYTKVFGAQVGLYNKAREVYGFQIGLINSTESLHGLQIGLVNFHTRGLFSISPIINFGF
jgi:hypothetical protein